MTRMTCETRDGQLYLVGVIDETATLLEIPGRAVNGLLVLDLAGITFINSQGVREWIRMQQVAAKLGIRIELRRVAEPVIHQLNIVPATRGVSLVSSFVAPYECEYCDTEHDVVIDVAKHGAQLARMKPPPIPCPDCQRPMAFANLPELYFTFLAG
jgi:anti-anti-sigma regulatory factor